MPFHNSFPWSRYSRKLATKIEKPRHGGHFSQEESEARQVRLILGEAGNEEDGNFVRFYWLVDKEDGIIIDTKFQVYGQSALIGAAEVACELLIGKNYDQAQRISATLIDQQVRDKQDQPAFPSETAPHLNLVLEAIEHAAEQCRDIPLPTSYVSTPIPKELDEMNEGGYPGWLELNEPQKIAIIEEVLNQDIRPYIALDAGGVEVVSLTEKNELIIAYQGSCTSCYSSIGTTLSYIQQILRARVSPAIKVIPDFTFNQT